MKRYINQSDIDSIINSNHQRPADILGLNAIFGGGGFYINAYQPHAKAITIVDKDNKLEYQMEKIDERGFFTFELEKPISYYLKFEGYQDNHWEMHDPYSFKRILKELDIYLFNQGTHYEIYEKLGAHIMEIDGVKGVHFAVWAPNAKRVSVVGDFSGWDGRIYQMNKVEDSGIYEIFIPGLVQGEVYKYEIKTQNDDIILKADPYATYSELRPANGSRIYDIENYEWKDKGWIEKREKFDSYNRPISVYEVHLGSWLKNDSENGFLNYRELAHKLTDYVKKMNYTHIELMPVSEHPFDGSWGYQVTGYFAPTARYGNPDDFMYFVDYLHQNDIGIILDWVPAHFPKDQHGLRRFDGTALYEHETSAQGEHPHWGTLIYNYGRNEVKLFLIANALYWIEKFHIDGLRVDAVASMLYLDYGKENGQWVPNKYGGRENIEAVEFFKHLNSMIYQRNPGVMMMAEESTAWPNITKPTSEDGLGFGFKWNMGWMNDYIKYITKDSIYKKYHHHDLTFSMIYAYTENFILPFSHDEVVHGKGSMINKMPGDYWQKFANLRCTYGYMYGHPGKKLLFMGNDIGQFNEWSEERSIEWNLLEYEKHLGLNKYVSDLNALYKKEKAFWEKDYDHTGFSWINCNDAESSMVSFMRFAYNPENCLIFISNFTPVPKLDHRIGVPYFGEYIEILNSDDEKYGGSGVKNTEKLEAEFISYDQLDQSIKLKVPPLATIILKYQKKETKKTEVIENKNDKKKKSISKKDDTSKKPKATTRARAKEADTDKKPKATTRVKAKKDDTSKKPKATTRARAKEDDTDEKPSSPKKPKIATSPNQARKKETTTKNTSKKSKTSIKKVKKEKE